MDFFGTLANDLDSMSSSIRHREELRDVLQSNLYLADALQQQQDLDRMSRTPDVFSAIARGVEAGIGRRF